MPVFKMILVGGMDVQAIPFEQRWLLREHAAETQASFGPWLAKFVRYSSVLPPADIVPDVVRLGSYTTGVTMHVYRDFPPEPAAQWGMVGIAPNSLASTGMTSAQAWAMITKTQEEQQRLGSPVKSASAYVPFAPTDDLLGADLNPWAGTILRWVTCFRFPDGVSREQGDDWYLNVHAHEVTKQEGLLRFYSYRTLDWPATAKWHRVTELWYRDFPSWKKAVVDSPPAYTRPSWSRYAEYPFLEPHKDFLGSFILERPTHDFLEDRSSYVIGP